MAEAPMMSRRNAFLSFLLAIALLFNLGIMFQNRLTTEAPTIHVYKNSSNLYSKSFDAYIHVAFFGKYAFRNMKIVRGIARTFHTMLEHTDSPIYLHVLLDLASKLRTARTLKGTARHFRRRLNVSYFFINISSKMNHHLVWQYICNPFKQF